MASIVGKEFKNKRTNELLKVSSIENNIAILENEQRIAVERLLDPRFYTENKYSKTNETNNQYNNSQSINDAINNVSRNGNMDSNINENNSFNLDTSNLHNSLLHDIQTKLGNHDDFQDDYSGVSHRVVDPVESHSDAQRNQRDQHNAHTPSNTNEQELIERAQKRREQATREANKQQSALKEKLKLEEDDFDRPIENNNFKGVTQDGKPIDDDRDVSVTMKDENNQEVSRHSRQQNREPIKEENPMFKKMKRVKKHTLKIEFEELLPEKELLKMLENGFEDSVLDYLTDEVASKVFSNVDIKDKIKKQLEEYTYGKKRSTPTKKRTSTKKTNNTKTSKTVANKTSAKKDTNTKEK